MDQIISYIDLVEIVTGAIPKPEPMTNDYKCKTKNNLLPFA